MGKCLWSDSNTSYLALLLVLLAAKSHTQHTPGVSVTAERTQVARHGVFNHGPAMCGSVRVFAAREARHAG